MSAIDDASLTMGSRSPDRHNPDHPSLPVFSPVRRPSDRPGSSAESSSRASRQIATDIRRRSRSNHRESLVLDNSDGATESSALSRRQRHRTSGGFLLDSGGNTSRLSRSIFSRSQKDKSGKRKSEISETVSTKRESRVSGIATQTSIDSSSLSSQLKGDENDHGTNRQHLKPPNGLAVTPQQHPSARSHASISASPPAPLAVGYDTDPAQIVDMALRLSEGRRKQAAGNRLVSSHSVEHQILPTSNFNQPDKLNTSLGRYLASSSHQRPQTPPRSIGAQTSQVESQEDSPSLAASTKSLLEVSKATAARVEKAKTYLELAYEHRRLLPHLPPIRNPDFDNTGTVNVPVSRVYNPLQYARNRKLRLRQKSGINAEAEGWHDVQKVRAWVDAVVNSHTETKHNPLECVRLPPLSLSEDDETKVGQIGTSPGAKDQITKPRRPKSDWQTHPGDLLADAAWLEQGLNKTKIEDRESHAIYPPDTNFVFSGWRNQTPVQIPEELQELQPPSQSHEDNKPMPLPFATAPALPEFKSTHRPRRTDAIKRTGERIRQTIARDGDQKTIGQTGFLSRDSSDADSVSSLNRSESERPRRGRRRSFRNNANFSLSDGDPFAAPIQAAVPSPSPQQTKMRGDVNTTDDDDSMTESARRSDDQALHAETHRGSSDPEIRTSKDERLKQISGRWRSNTKDTLNLPRSSLEYDSTAPTSPEHTGFPSIAISLDPPRSRSISPIKKQRPSILRAIKDRSTERAGKHESTARRSISHSREASAEFARPASPLAEDSRGTSPSGRGHSPLNRSRSQSTTSFDGRPGHLDHRHSTASTSSSKPTARSGDPPRLRGVFKGGRIAELVGNEVSRVGDFIWKRDPPAVYKSHRSPSDSSPNTASDAESSKLNGMAWRTPLNNVDAQSQLQKSVNNASSGSSKSNESPKYFNPNLPSFTSPFQRDREKLEKERRRLEPTPSSLQPGDHISRQVTDHRARSKSPRFDRLAPPRLDTSGSRSPALDHRSSYGFGPALDLTKSRSASQALSNAIHRGSINVDGRSDSQRDADSISSAVRSVKKQDLLRLRGLLLLSAVKAKGISSLQSEIQTSIPQHLAKLVPAGTYSELQAKPRNIQHLNAARVLLVTLTDQSTRFSDDLHRFSHTSIPALHAEIQKLEDLVDQTLTPRVRAAADAASRLSVQLTTTSTMAVKGLNDQVSDAYRVRRHGVARLLRLFAFAGVEWAVVSLLWAIWLVVTLIRIVLGIIRGGVKVVRWMLWVQ